MDQQSPQPVQSAVDQLRAQNQQARGKFQAQQDESTQYFLQSLQNQSGPVSQALSILGDKSKAGQIGKAIQTPAYAGYCQQFADDTTGTKERYPTAIATWQAKVKGGQAQTDVNKAKEGDVIEFAPDQTNQNLGHAAVVQKDGSLKMATDNGVQSFTLKEWTTHSGQTPLGFYTP